MVAARLKAARKKVANSNRECVRSGFKRNDIPECGFFARSKGYWRVGNFIFPGLLRGILRLSFPPRWQRPVAPLDAEQLIQRWREARRSLSPEPSADATAASTPMPGEHVACPKLRRQAERPQEYLLTNKNVHDERTDAAATK